jgi:hypothetical protein
MADWDSAFVFALLTILFFAFRKIRLSYYFAHRKTGAG